MPNLEQPLWRWYHNVSECFYHIQLTIKYRKAVLFPDIQQSILDTLKGFKERFAIEIHEIGFDQNHIHILCQFLPKYSGGQVIKLIKSMTARSALKIPAVKKELWGGEFWTDGYYISTIGSRGNRKTIEIYIKNQGAEGSTKERIEQLQLFSV